MRRGTGAALVRGAEWLSEGISRLRGEKKEERVGGDGRSRGQRLAPGLGIIKTRKIATSGCDPRCIGSGDGPR